MGGFGNIAIGLNRGLNEMEDRRAEQAKAGLYEKLTNQNLVRGQQAIDEGTLALAEKKRAIEARKAPVRLSQIAPNSFKDPEIRGMHTNLIKSLTQDWQEDPNNPEDIITSQESWERVKATAANDENIAKEYHGIKLNKIEREAQGRLATNPDDTQAQATLQAVMKAKLAVDTGHQAKLEEERVKNEGKVADKKISRNISSDGYYLYDDGVKSNIKAYIKLDKDSNAAGQKFFPTNFVGSDGVPYVIDRNGTMRPAVVEGGGTTIPKPSAFNPESAAKTQLIEQALTYVPKIRMGILGADPSNPNIDRTDIANIGLRTYGTKGRELSTLILDAVEAKLRAESGAAVPETEVTRIAKRYIPQIGDKDSTIILKIDNLEQFLKGTSEKINRGRSGTDTPNKTSTGNRFTIERIP